MLMRQTDATHGDILIDGRNIYSLDSDTCRGFGYCAQENAFFDTFTAREMLMYYSCLRGVPLNNLSAFVDAWIRASKLSEHANTACKNLSGGNKRKLSLAIAIVGDPQLVVLDEPSAGVDPAARRKLWRVINAVKVNLLSWLFLMILMLSL